MVYELSLKNVIKNHPGIKLGNAKGTILHSPSLGRNHLVSCQLGWIWAAAHRLAAHRPADFLCSAWASASTKVGKTSMSMQHRLGGSRLQQSNMQTKQLKIHF